VRQAWGLLIVAAIGITIEKIWRRHDQPSLRPGLRTDLLHFLFTGLLQTACLLLAAVVCYVVLSPFTLDTTNRWLEAQPVLVQGALGFVIFTFALYWYHRLSHTVAFLWRFHAVHHSSERLDWAAAARLHPMELFFGGFLVAPPLILLGFEPLSLGVFSTIATAWAVVEHANVRWRLRWMDRLYPNPEYHHWHHSNHPEARNKNFGIPIWDTLFGTYYLPAHHRPLVYGIDEPVPDTYLGQLAHPFRRRRAAGLTAF
jgi:sterol desaturase/sphingolipid hydroxylase (fatty acid hydroxylase superfamily)